MRRSSASDPLLAETRDWSHLGRVSENATIARQGYPRLLQALLDGDLRVVDQRLTNVLVVYLVLFGDGQRFDDGSAGGLSQVAELDVVVVLSWAEIGLASGQSSLHLLVQKSVCKSKAFPGCCQLLFVFELRFERRAEQTFTALISLQEEKRKELGVEPEEITRWKLT